MVPKVCVSRGCRDEGSTLGGFEYQGLGSPEFECWRIKGPGPLESLTGEVDSETRGQRTLEVWVNWWSRTPRVEMGLRAESGVQGSKIPEVLVFGGIGGKVPWSLSGKDLPLGLRSLGRSGVRSPRSLGGFEDEVGDLQSLTGRKTSVGSS